MCLFLAVTPSRSATERSCIASISPLFANTRDTRLVARGRLPSPHQKQLLERIDFLSLAGPQLYCLNLSLDAVLSVAVSTLGPFD
jgi:hypothetical protein